MLTFILLQACTSDIGLSEIEPAREASVSLIETQLGTHILLNSNNMFQYKYDSVARCTYITDRYSAYHLGYDPATITYEKFSAVEGENYKFKITYNGDGYISTLGGNYRTKAGMETRQGDWTVRYGYDYSGHLVSIDAAGEGILFDGYTRYDYDTGIQGTLTWEEGNLTRLRGRIWGLEGGGRWTMDTVCDLSYGTQPNLCRQQTFAPLAYANDDGLLDISFAFAGMLGTVSAELPVGYIYTYTITTEEGESYTGTNVGNVDYFIFPRYGTVLVEYLDWDDNACHYQYFYSSDVKFPVAQQEEPTQLQPFTRTPALLSCPAERAYLSYRARREAGEG